MALPQTPLDSVDPDRALVVKRKIADRTKDVGRHLRALRAAMATFGEDFDLDAFQAAFEADDPALLNQVKAVERGVDQLHNYIADLAALGLELAGLRQREDELNAARDLRRLRDIRVLSGERMGRLQTLREVRRLLVHEYATATAEQVHAAALIVSTEIPNFNRTFGRWLKDGFSPERSS